jgi:hypothetical protein
MTKKICKDCDTEKNINEFYKNKTSKDGYNNDCRECFIIKRKKYIKEYEKRDNVKKYRKTLNIKYKKRNYYKDIELSRKINRERRKKEREKNRIAINQKRRKYYKHKMETDPLYKLKKNIRSRIYFYTKYEGKSKTTFEIVGITAHELKNYLEQKFTEGMSWQNQGQWHIDHIIPLSSSKTKEELYKLCHYTNLQPLWANDNMRKNNKILVL